MSKNVWHHAARRNLEVRWKKSTSSTEWFFYAIISYHWLSNFHTEEMITQQWRRSKVTGLGAFSIVSCKSQETLSISRIPARSYILYLNLNWFQVSSELQLHHFHVLTHHPRAAHVHTFCSVSFIECAFGKKKNPKRLTTVLFFSPPQLANEIRHVL